MATAEERRAEGIERLPVQALVEVCGTNGDVPAFEAESSDISGRGMHLRTAYLPELGATVVCRLDGGGQEILAEGVVAWCREEDRGGRFGVKFTALDAPSATALEQLLRLPEVSGEGAEGDGPPDHPADAALVAGAKVKLHIEGLSAPMRARVKQAGSRHVQVGSSLEFLRVGKRLAVETMQDGENREARIEGVQIQVDPETHVPQLIVVLRTREGDATPEPSVVTLEPDVAASFAVSPLTDTDPASEVVREATDLCGRVGGAFASCRKATGRVGGQLIALGARLGQPGTSRLGGLLARVMRSKDRAETGMPPRRRTSPPPSERPAAVLRQLRPQRQRLDSNREQEEFSQQLRASRRRYTPFMAAGAAIAVVAAVWASSSGGDPSKSARPEPPSLAKAPPEPAALVVASAAAPSASAQVGPVTANVPLFGPTPMATLEPAPLQPMPVADATQSVEARERALAKLDGLPVVGGQTTQDPSTGAKDEKDKPSSIRPEDVEPWGKGKMRHPVIHRMAIDSPGEKLEGKASRDGFSVIITGRKSLESPAGFARRDARIAKVSASNTARGVRIVWTFRGEVPGYRVRLRKSAVEFLISETTGESQATNR